jgi:predicted Rossmann fold flavoprotein
MPKTSHRLKSAVVWDVVVLGGGPAGMMAAAEAARKGVRVCLLEQNQSLGKKLLITGGGRCNITNNKPTVRTMLSAYGDSGKYLFSAFTQHGVVETLAYFADRGLQCVEENDGRLFPETLQAKSVYDVLVADMQDAGVVVKVGVAVAGITRPQDRFLIETKHAGVIEAKRCIVATGGTSHPETGATGAGFTWLTSLGHTVTPDSVSLVPIALKDSWLTGLGGVTLPAVELRLLELGKVTTKQRGRLLCTHFGISGPAALQLSGAVGDALQYGAVSLELDLMPEQSREVLDETIHALCLTTQNKTIRNALGTLLPKAVCGPLLLACDINPDTPCHSLTRTARQTLVRYLKSVPLAVKGLLGADKAVVAGGGVHLDEIDFRTMESRLVPGLYVVGDLLNIRRPSGGYSLQLCWSTGFVAGNKAGEAHVG